MHFSKWEKNSSITGYLKNQLDRKEIVDFFQKQTCKKENYKAFNFETFIWDGGFAFVVLETWKLGMKDELWLSLWEPDLIFFA